MAYTAQQWQAFAINARRRANEYLAWSRDPETSSNWQPRFAKEAEHSNKLARFYLSNARMAQHNRSTMRL